MAASQFTPKMNIARLETCQRLLAHYKNEGNGFLYSTVTGDKFLCVTVTQNWKASHLNIVTPLLPKRKNSGLSLLLETACTQHSFLVLRRHRSTGVHDWRHKTWLADLHEVPEEVGNTTQSLLLLKSQCFSNTKMPVPTLLLLLQRWYWTSDWMFFLVLLTAKIGHHLHLIDCNSLVSSQRNSHYMLWRSSSC